MERVPLFGTSRGLNLLVREAKAWKQKQGTTLVTNHPFFLEIVLSVLPWNRPEIKLYQDPIYDLLARSTPSSLKMLLWTRLLWKQDVQTGGTHIPTLSNDHDTDPEVAWRISIGRRDNSDYSMVH